jgi:class 3 adenylate cyclase
VAALQVEAWDEFFYSGAYRMNERCRVTTETSDHAGVRADDPSAEFHPITIPHRPAALAPLFTGPGRFASVHYACDIDTAALPTNAGMTYLHAGWIFGDEAQVLVNGSLRATLSGADKAAVALTKGDLSARSARIDILVSGPRDAPIGLIGYRPMAVSVGAAANAKIFAYDATVRIVYYFLYLVPTLTLGSILVMGWLLGLRLRLLHTAFFYFSMSTAHMIVHIVGEYLPFDPTVNVFLYEPFQLGENAAFLILGLELLGLSGRSIPKLMAAIVALVAALVAVVLHSGDAWFVHEHVTAWTPVATTILALPILVGGTYKIKKASAAPPWPNIQRVYLGFLALLCIFASIEQWCIHAGSTVRLTPYVYLAMPLAAGAIVVLVLALYERGYRREKSVREALSSVAEKYVPRQIVAAAHERNVTDLGGDMRMITSMFVDIRGFTHLSGQLGPTSVVHLLNRFFGEVQAVVRDQGGYIDKFLGDGALVTWGAHGQAAADQDVRSSAFSAVRSALALFDRVDELNVRLKAEGLPRLDIGIGIHMGEAVVGNIGASERMEFTSIGPTVNFASRLEGLTKVLNCRLVVSTAVFAAIPTSFDVWDWEAASNVEIRGVEHPVDVMIQRRPSLQGSDRAYSSKAPHSVAS